MYSDSLVQCTLEFLNGIRRLKFHCLTAEKTSVTRRRTMSKTPLHNCFVDCTKCGKRTDLNAPGCHVETDGNTWQIQCQNALCSHIDQYLESDFVCQLVV